jgi:hypothetical protein
MASRLWGCVWGRGGGDALRVARQIAEHGFWPSEWVLSVNDPFDLLERRKEGGERIWIGKACVIAEELWVVDLMRCGEHLQKHASQEA